MIKKIGKVLVVNVKYYRGEVFTYIGRKNDFYGFEGSVLANRKRDNGMSRDESIERYRVWLWEEVKKKGEVWNELVRLVEKLKKGEDVVLGCWCKPKRCHGDVVKSCLEWMLKK